MENEEAITILEVYRDDAVVKAIKYKGLDETQELTKFNWDIVRAFNMAIKALKRPHGEWLDNSTLIISSICGSLGISSKSCSVCHRVQTDTFINNFCPNCGADMREARE